MNRSHIGNYLISHKKQSDFVDGLNQDKVSYALLAKLIDVLFASFSKTNSNDQQKYKTILNNLHKNIAININKSFDNSLDLLKAIRTFGNFVRIIANNDSNQEIKQLIKQFEFGYHAQALNIAQSGESEVLASALSFLDNREDPIIIFDVGANKGEFIKAVLKINRFVNIHSFEPQLAMLDDLNRIVHEEFIKNECHKVFVSPLGLSNKNGNFDLFTSSKDDVLASTIEKVGDSFANTKQIPETIELMKGEDYCLNNNIKFIDYLKVDTEGSELEVLLGFQSMIKNKSIKMIQFEYGVNTALASNTLMDFYSLLEEEFVLAKILPEGLYIMPEYDVAFENFYWANYIALHKNIAFKFIDYLQK